MMLPIAIIFLLYPLLLLLSDCKAGARSTSLTFQAAGAEVHEEGVATTKYVHSDPSTLSGRYAGGGGEYRKNYFSTVVYGEGHPLCAFLDSQGYTIEQFGGASCSLYLYQNNGEPGACKMAGVTCDTSGNIIGIHILKLNNDRGESTLGFIPWLYIKSLTYLSFLRIDVDILENNKNRIPISGIFVNQFCVLDFNFKSPLELCNHTWSDIQNISPHANEVCFTNRNDLKCKLISDKYIKDKFGISPPERFLLNSKNSEEEPSFSSIFLTSYEIETYESFSSSLSKNVALDSLADGCGQFCDLISSCSSYTCDCVSDPYNCACGSDTYSCGCGDPYNCACGSDSYNCGCGDPNNCGCGDPMNCWCGYYYGSGYSCPCNSQDYTCPCGTQDYSCSCGQSFSCSCGTQDYSCSCGQSYSCSCGESYSCSCGESYTCSCGHSYSCCCESQDCSIPSASCGTCGATCNGCDDVPTHSCGLYCNAIDCSGNCAPIDACPYSYCTFDCATGCNCILQTPIESPTEFPTPIPTPRPSHIGSELYEFSYTFSNNAIDAYGTVGPLYICSQIQVNLCDFGAYLLVGIPYVRLIDAVTNVEIIGSSGPDNPCDGVGGSDDYNSIRTRSSLSYTPNTGSSCKDVILRIGCSGSNLCEGVAAVTFNRYPSSEPSSRPSTYVSAEAFALCAFKEGLTAFPAFSSSSPSFLPSRFPSSQPSSQPSRQPSTQPSRQPSSQPSMQPSRQPSANPSLAPLPTQAPTPIPTANPSLVPFPTRVPTKSPSAVPSYNPTTGPSPQPSTQPSPNPTFQPTILPTKSPSIAPTYLPTKAPSAVPSYNPTTGPSPQPLPNPTFQPTILPTKSPSIAPTYLPTKAPSASPSFSFKPSTLSCDPCVDPQCPDYSGGMCRRRLLADDSRAPSDPDSTEKHTEDTTSVLQNKIFPLIPNLNTYSHTNREKRRKLIDFVGWDCNGVVGDFGVTIPPPCGVGSTTWTGVTCGTGLLANKVIALNMESFGGSLAGPISTITALSRLRALSRLDLGNNQLTGSIPPQISFLSSLTYLALNGNKLSGGLPSELMVLTSLTDLLLQNNKFSSFIPYQISALANLRILYLYDNQLQGPAGSFLCISTLTLLGSLRIQNQ